MTYKEFKDRVLQTIMQYTLAGEPIEPSYNAQADYENRIPGLLNSCLMYLSTTVRKIMETFRVDWETAEVRDGFYILKMPSDFWQMCGRAIPILQAGKLQLYHNYHWLGQNRMLIPETDKADMEITYYRYPHKVPVKPADAYELDGCPEAQEAAIFYVAAFLVMQEDPFAYQALYNQYEARRVEMSGDIQTEYDQIEDQYNIDSPGLYQ